MTVIGVAFGWLYITTKPKVKRVRKDFMVSHGFHMHGLQIARLHRSGKEALARDVNRQLEKSMKVQAYVFRGNDILASPWKPSPVIVKLAEQARLSQKSMRHQLSTKKALFAVPMEVAQRRNYVVVGVMPYRTRLEQYIEPKTLVWRLLILLVVTGVVCYLLARFLTWPLHRLQLTAQRLARGDLEARVDPEVRELRDEVGELAHDFDVMAERIKLLLDSQKRLVLDISHELRSPLARLRVALELARQKASTNAQPNLDRIERETERLNTLIGELLTLSQLESGHRAMHRESLSLETLLQDVVQDANFEANAKQRTVKLLGHQGVLLQGDKELLRRAIENVVRNAIRFTPVDSSVEVRLEADAATQSATLQIRDHGPGVPNEALETLFQPFFQVEEARTPHHGGKGLGLAITRSSVLLHEGQIKAENAKEGGLVVTIVLPVEVVSMGQAEAA